MLAYHTHVLLSAYACISTRSEGVHNSAVQSACVLNRVPYTDQHLTAELDSECQLVLVEYAEHVSTVAWFARHVILRFAVHKLLLHRVGVCEEFKINSDVQSVSISQLELVH